MSSFSWEGISSIASDDADKGSSGDTGADKDLMDALTYNASSLSVRVFEAHYEGINRCNQALNIVPQLDKATPALRTRLVGEAKILRAFMYLVKNVWRSTYIDHLPNPSSDDDRIMQLTRKLSRSLCFHRK
jgi:hypothetical protein